MDICPSSSFGSSCSACVEKPSRSEKKTVRNRASTPKVSGCPDLISSLTTSRGTKEENDCSELRNKDAVDWSCAISLILEGRISGLSNDKSSTDFNSREMLAIGRDRRADRK